MSWDIRLLNENGERVEVPLYEEGGTRPMGGSTHAELNVTYNYGDVFRLVFAEKGGFDGVLQGRVAEEVIPDLDRAVQILGVKQWKDYWAPTPGNAGHALSILLAWAKQHPKARFQVS